MSPSMRGMRRPVSVGLESLFEPFLLALYKHWYKLPLKSTRRYLESMRQALAQELLEADITEVGAGAAIERFVSEADALPHVHTYAGDEVRQLQESLVRLPNTRTMLSVEARQKLAQMLQEPEPTVFALSQMHYRTSRLAQTLAHVRQRLDEGHGRFTDAVQQQIDQILHAGDARLQAVGSHIIHRNEALEDLLNALEQIPQVVRVAHTAFLAGKVDARASTSPMRGGGRGTLRGGGRESVRSAGATQEVESAVSLEQKIVTDINYYTNVKFPRKVKTGEVEPLIVRLTLAPPTDSRVEGQVSVAFAEPQQPEYVEVVAIAPGFSEETDSWSRTIAVYSDQDSQPAIFLLSSEESGPQRITIEFRHKGRHLGSFNFVTEINRHLRAMGDGVEPNVSPQFGQFSSNPPPPADLELRVTSGIDGNTLHFMLHSPKAEVGYHWRPMGKVTMRQKDPQQFLASRFKKLSELAGSISGNGNDAKSKQSIRHLEQLGVELYEQLFPPELQREYWKRITKLRQKGTINSLLITSDEPWIPWEMIKPYYQDEYDTDIEEEDGFLAEEFEFCRWLAGHGPAEQVNITSARLIAPQLDLPFVEIERKYFDRLSQQEGIEIAAPLNQVDEVLDTVQQGGFELLHFSAHGLFNSDDPGRAPLSLQDGELTPFDLTGRQASGMRRAKPIVFLNACHAGLMGFSLTGLGGWAETMVGDIRVTAFIGALWEVNDKLAAAFATRFYDELRAEKTLGQAFSAARLYIRDQNPGNPTWLAYTLYADPNAVVTWNR